MPTVLRYVIYGKIIIDEIELEAGTIHRSLLGGGGPQAAFGARLWHESVGLLTRSGDDMDPEHVETLKNLCVDLNGWYRFPDIPTPHSRMTYDENEYLVGSGISTQDRDDWFRLLDQRLELPPTYREPRVIHLITEFPEEPMVETVLELHDQGVIFSLEPLPFKPKGKSRDNMLALLEQVDVVTPDWPTASGLAGSNDPAKVMRFWAGLGPNVVAVRHGAQGSYVWSRKEGETWHIPPVPTEAVDPTGAGNAYGGGLCVGWGETGDARLAGCYAAISASYLVRTLGMPAMSDELPKQARALLKDTLASVRPLLQ